LPYTNMFWYLIPMAITGLIGWTVYEDREHITSYYPDHSLVDTVKNTAQRMVIRGMVIVNEIKFKAQVLCESGVKKTGKHTYELTYFVGHTRYKMPIKSVRKPNPIARVLSGVYTDVTQTILEYYGIQQDWHNVQLTPKSLGFNTLTFELQSGTVLIFDDDEIINISESGGRFALLFGS
jgi:hypothetical protein